MVKARNWKKVNKDYVLDCGNTIARLKFSEIGVYCLGRGFRLEVRRKDSADFKPLGYVFWTSPDGTYHSYKEDPYSVENRLFQNEKEILKKASEILEALGFL